jgi:hypothetical protein
MRYYFGAIVSSVLHNTEAVCKQKDFATFHLFNTLCGVTMPLNIIRTTQNTEVAYPAIVGLGKRGTVGYANTTSIGGFVYFMTLLLSLFGTGFCFLVASM